MNIMISDNNLNSESRSYNSSSSDSDSGTNNMNKCYKQKKVLSDPSDNETGNRADKNSTAQKKRVVSAISPSKMKANSTNENFEGSSRDTYWLSSDESDSELEDGLIKNTTAKDFSGMSLNFESRSTRKRKAQNHDSDVKPPKIACTSKSIPKSKDDELDSFSKACNQQNRCSPRRKGNEVNHNILKNRKVTEINSPKNNSARKTLFSPEKNVCSSQTALEKCQSPMKGSRTKETDQKNRNKTLTLSKICKDLENDFSDDDDEEEETYQSKNKKLETKKELNESLKDLKSLNESSPSKRVVTSNTFSPKYQNSTRSVSKLCSLDSNDAQLKIFSPATGTPKKETRNTPLKIALRNCVDIKCLNEQSPKKMEKDPELPWSAQKRTRASQKSKTNEILDLDDNGPISFTETPLKEKNLSINNQEEMKENEKSSQNNYSTPTKRGKKKSAAEKRTPLSSIKHSEISSQNKSPSSLNKIISGTTPKSKKTSRGVLTPSMAKKEQETCEIVEGALDITRKQLHISTIPKSLPCRNGEFSQIESFLTKKIEHASGGCMYISGVPGTGKTATVHAVIRHLQHKVDEHELPDFDFVEVNGLRLTEPKQAYVQIYEALTERKLTPDQAQQHLNRRFSGACKKPTIILVDELDYLCNRRQDVVYNILDWPSKRSSRLAVLTISNTMDLPERTLKGRVTSRMGLTRLVFQPYTYHQLREIVLDRLCGTSIFHPDAVQLVVRKVAAVSGDARRALDICRRTMEQVGQEEQVSVIHVEKALTQIFSGPRVQVIQGLSGLSQLVLRAVRDVNHRTGVDEATVRQVYQHLQQICILEGFLLPSVGAVLQTVVSLVSSGLVVAEKGRLDIARKLSLNVSSDDIHYALDDLKKSL